MEIIKGKEIIELGCLDEMGELQRKESVKSDANEDEKEKSELRASPSVAYKTRSFHPVKHNLFPTLYFYFLNIFSSIQIKDAIL